MNQETAARPLQHVLLTGAASGIGAECARKLRARGVRITALDIAEPATAVDHFCTLDLADASSIEQAVAFALTHGPFDALLNIAGIPPRPGQELKVLTVNWLGQRQLTEGVLDGLNAGGAIVNMASRAGAQWRDNLEQVKALIASEDAAAMQSLIDAGAVDATRAYNLSKEAMIVWSIALTEQLKSRELRVNSVSPAAVDTGILDDFKTAFGERVAQNIARVGRPGRPDEIADLALFLASPESHWIRGMDIVIDGGMGAMIQSDVLGLSSS